MKFHAHDDGNFAKSSNKLGNFTPNGLNFDTREENLRDFASMLRWTFVVVVAALGRENHAIMGLAKSVFFEGFRVFLVIALSNLTGI